MNESDEGSNGVDVIYDVNLEDKDADTDDAEIASRSQNLVSGVEASSSVRPRCSMV